MRISNKIHHYIHTVCNNVNSCHKRLSWQEMCGQFGELTKLSRIVLTLNMRILCTHFANFNVRARG